MDKIDTYTRWNQNPSKGEVFTPKELVNEMLDKIPFEVWENPKSTFCDLSMGKGTFLVEIVKRLTYIYKYSEEDAKSRVFGYEVRVKYINYLKRRGYNNLYHVDTLKEKIDMKFDVVIGNPPYQSNEDRTAMGNKVKSYKQPLWPLIVKKSMDLTNEGGYNCFVTPMSWIAGTYDIRKGRVYLLKEMTSIFSMEYCNLNSEMISKTYFNGVGSTFSYFVAKKQKYDGKTLVETQYGESVMDLSKVNSIPLDPNPIKLSINSKTITSDKQKFNFKSVVFKPFGVDVKEPTETHTVKGYCNGGQMGEIIYSYWEKEDKYYGMRKVMIGKRDRSYLPFVDDEGLNIGQNQLWFLEMSIDDKYDTAVQIFNHPLYKFLIQSNKHGAGPETHLVYSLPYVDLSKTYTDNDIYDMFEITEEEQKYIDEIIK